MSLSTAQAPANLFQRLIAFRERFGAKRALFKALDVLLHKIGISVYGVVWLDVESLAPLAPLDPQFTFRLLTPDEIEKYATDHRYYLDAKLPDRVRAGRELCFGVLAGDRLAALGCYILEANEPGQAAGVAMSYPADVAYMSYGVTHPDFRGARLHGIAMGLALKELTSRGVTKLVSLVGWTNWSSLKSCDRLGYVHLGNMVVIGGRNGAIGLYPKAAKRLGVRFGRRAARRS